MRLKKIKNNETYYTPYRFNSNSYMITKKENVVICNCWAWKTCKAPNDEKICKHIIKYIDPRCFGTKVPSTLINKTKAL